MKTLNRSLIFSVLILLAVSLSACQGVTPVPSASAVIPTVTQPKPAFVLDATPVSYIHILRQKPLPGERLTLTPFIEIVFDRSMSQPETASAWKFVDSTGSPIAGDITWPDPATFRFTPAQPLNAGQIYSAIFSSQASALDGTSLPQDILLEFRTTDQLQVGQVFPAANAQDVDLHSAITVIFNKPVVPLMTREEQAALPPPIDIVPAVSGEGNWVNSSVYVFQPSAGMKSGTFYQVSVHPTLADTTGTPLGTSYDWSFSTGSPSVVDFGLKSIGMGYSGEVINVLLDQAFMLSFSQPMDKPSVVTSLTLSNVETGQIVPLKFAWDETSTQLTVTPSSRLSTASFYTLAVGTSATALDGGNLKLPYQIKLSTLPLPAIVSTDPAEGRQTYYSAVASLQFNTPMQAESLTSHFKISPEPSTPVKLFYREYENRLDIFGLDPSSDYVIRLQPGSTDIYGNAITTPFSLRLQTAAMSPYAHMVTPYYPLIFRQSGQQAFYFEYTNLNFATISLYRLSFQEFSNLTIGITRLEDIDKAAGTLVREIKPTLKAGRDRFARFLLDLGEQKPLEPGYYFLGLKAGPFDYTNRFLQGSTFIVSNDSLVLKATQGEALAWLVDSATGKPVPGAQVVFYNEAMAELGKSRTDENGVAHIQDVTNVQYVQSVDPAHLALAALGWGSGVNEGQFGIWTDYWSPVKNLFSYTYTERPLYRPNQPVFIKGILRLNDDLHYSLPALKEVYLVIENEQGRVFAGPAALSPNGTFASEYLLGADAPVGNYSITVREAANSENILSWSDFRVAEYVKPEFQVSASADPTIALSGDEVTFTLDAAYYSGGSLSNATVSWFMETLPYYYSPPEPYSAYSFNDYDNYDYYYTGAGSTGGPPVFKNGQGQTDEKGHFSLTEVLNLPEKTPNSQVNFSANITDVGGNLVGTGTSLTLLGSSLHAGIRPENYVSTAGEAQKFNLVVLDMQGQPVANQPVSVEMVEQRWFSVVRKDDNGVSSWETSVKTIPVGTATAITSAEGLASVEFTPPIGGQYKVTVTTLDEKKRPSAASTFLWVASREYVPWPQTNDRSFKLIADKSSYKPGDVAKILIAQPFEGENYALITTERGHIYEKQVVKLTSNSTIYELPITSGMAPVMYVSVMIVKGAGEATPPDFKMGLVRLNISPSDQQIVVTLKASQQSAKPGDTVTYTVQTNDMQGNPVQADVSLALVDKAVLALAPATSLPLIEAFYPLRGLSVVTSSSIVLNAEDFNANYQATDPTGQRAGGGGGKGEGDTGIVTVRDNFKDTAFWQAQVLTGKDGTATVQVTLPDNLTTWQMKARAITDDTRVGETESELLSTRPLQIQLQTPRFFVVEDAATLGAVIHNNTNQDMQVTVSLKAEGLTIASPANQVIKVPALQQAYVTWDATVQRDAQRVDLLASAESGSYADATRPTLGTLPGQGIPVLTFHVTETVGSAGYLREAGSVSEAISLPQTLDYLSATLNLQVSPSLAASMTTGLNYLNDYPYLCMEQTVSRFLPNLVSIEALKLAGKPTGDLQTSLDANVQPALQRIISNQNADGGWGLWPSSASQPNTTAYVILGLLEASKAGYTYPYSTLDRGLTYLNDQLPFAFLSTDGWQNNQAAFALYALASGGRPNSSRASTLYTYRDKLDLFGQALLMQALYLDDPADERIPTLLAGITGAASRSATGIWWDEKTTDYWNWNTDVRTTALVLNALIQVDPQNSIIPDGIRWLMMHREGSHWYSTQETAWSLMALTNWLSLSGEFKTNYQYAVTLNDTLLETRHAQAANLTDSYNLRLEAQQLLATQLNDLVISRDAGPGVLYYTAYMDYSLPVKDIPALDQGILVSEQYYNSEDLKTPITTAQRGDLIQVRLTLVVPDSLHYVVIDNPLPAGLEAIDSSLQTSQQVPGKYEIQDFDRQGWGWWYFYYKQIYDDRVVMSADYLPAGTYTITFMARAATAGQFHILPVTAREFYFPDISGRTAGTTFEVKP